MTNSSAFSNPFFLVLIAALLQLCIARNYNVVDYGAKADGETDSAAAFVAAWTAACNSDEESTVYVPTGTFLVNSMSFTGSCKRTMHLRISGVLVAPTSYTLFHYHEAWLEFKYLSGLSVDGGTIDARGSSFWECKRGGGTCPVGARSISLQSVNDTVINGLRSRNSQGVHVFINGCNNITMQNLTIVAPGDSPNTDGVHIGNSNVINVLSSNIGTGDDCISIGPGTNNMTMDNITCGPGHGISIGSMGGNPKETGVEHIIVNNSIFTSTDNGVRIKTWAKPSDAYAANIVFQNLKMNNVSNPIIIDQKYCPEKNCAKGESGVKVSDVTFKNITGTSRSEEALALICSAKEPCEDIKLQDINLSYINKPAASRCENAKVIDAGVVNPNCK